MSESDCLNDHDFELLYHTGKLANILKVAFLMDSNEAYLSLCSLITFGKNSSSPSKKVKRNARIELFSKIAYETFPIKNHGNIKLSYVEIASGLQTLSERWSRFSFDELLSLVIVIDVNEKGSLSADDFTIFTDLVDDAVHHNPGSHMTALASLYSRLREDLMGAAIANSADEILLRKLAVLANTTRHFGQAPLALLVSQLEQGGHWGDNDALMEFVKQMMAFVQQCIDVQTQVSREGSPQHATRTTSHGSDGSSIRSGMGGPEDAEDDEDDHCVNVHPFTEADVAPLPTLPVSVVASGRLSLASSTSDDASKRFGGVSEASDVISPLVISGNSRAPETEEELSRSPDASSRGAANVISGQLQGLDIKGALLNSLTIFREKAAQIASSLDSYDAQLQHSALVLRDLNLMETQLRAAQDLCRRAVREEVPSVAGAGRVSVAAAIQSEGGENDTHHRPNASAATNGFVSSDRANQPHSVSTEPTPEVDNTPITRMLGGVGNQPAVPSEQRADRNERHPSSTGVTAAASGHRKYRHLVSNLQFYQDVLRDQPSAATQSGGRIAEPVHHYHEQRHLHQVLRQKHQQQARRGAQQLSRPGGAQQKTTPLFEAPPPRVNLTIFRSPLKRQVHGNVNKYSRDAVGWQATGTLTNRYNERFQSTNDLRIASKVNRVLYGEPPN